jgi:hypothetical protein
MYCPSIWSGIIKKRLEFESTRSILIYTPSRLELFR